MRVVVTGASGLIGMALTDVLEADGHEVVRLVRREPLTYDEVRWDPAAGRLDPRLLGRVDAAVNLAGAGVGARRWTDAYKRLMWRSRIDSTTVLARALAGLPDPPRVLLSASGVDYYADVGGEPVDESGPPGAAFLSGLCQDWEAATGPAADAGVRVCLLRFGVVLSGRGGALGAMLPLFRLGLGGRLGAGDQYWTWVALADVLRAARFLLRRDDVAGPVNVVAPEPVTNAELTYVLGAALRRPAVLPAPAAALRLALGEYADQILASRRVLPRRLLDAGFVFRCPAIEAAVAAALRGY
ncbi:MAG: TIGR01777 family oxidoreductase [Streptosporangiales bacterium]|nr:TIGR01777 family oxidoreductase [Streptosporangiales bacterium]